jgi:hypothetical protein
MQTTCLLGSHETPNLLVYQLDQGRFPHEQNEYIFFQKLIRFHKFKIIIFHDLI